MRRKDSQGVWDGHVHTAMFKMDNQQGPPVQHRKLCSTLGGSLDGRRVWGRMDTGICLAESPCCSPKTVTALLTRYTPKQNKKVKKKKNRMQKLRFLEFPGVQWLGFGTCTARARVQSLIGQLRSCKQVAWPKKKKEQKVSFHFQLIRA